MARGWHLDGEVILQTYTPDHFVFTHVKNHDYESFFEEELEGLLAQGWHVTVVLPSGRIVVSND